MNRRGERSDLEDVIRSTLAARQRRPVEDPDLKCAAVLIPLVCRQGEWRFVVTLRTETVGHHRGQISFPGGACEPGDKDLQATALREAEEEIGVPPQSIEILGALDDYPTISRFVVTPIVAVIPSSVTYTLNRDEVAAVIEVPLSFLKDDQNLRVEQRQYQGQTYDVLFWDYGPYVIWGATAQMLKSLLDLCL